jgi:hypothetical protein
MTLREAFHKAKWRDFLHRPSHGSSRWSKAYFAGCENVIKTLSALADDWEVIPAPMDFAEAMAALHQGKRIKRRSWEGYWIKPGESFHVDKDLFNATDWEVVEG